MDMQKAMVEKAKETRNVSFSGVSAMVDAVLRFSSITVKDQDKKLVNAAIENNNIEEIWKLISSETIDLQTALVSALERVSDSNTGVSTDCVSPAQDNVTMLRQLLDRLENINQHFQRSGLSLLSIAVANEAVECVKVLLQAGAEPNQWDLSEKITALHAVAETRPPVTAELLELLIQHGGNINNGIEKNGGSVLHYGVSKGNYPMVKYLLDHKVETVCKTFHETALHTAVEQDDPSMAELLLEANRGCANSLMDATKRHSPLHVAAEAGFTETCRVLLNFGADVSLLTGNNETALHRAARNLNLEVLKRLLDQAEELQTVRQRLSTDHSSIIRTLVVRSEDSRIMADIKSLR